MSVKPGQAQTNELADELRRWGEDEVAGAVGSLDEEAIALVERLAVRYAGEPRTSIGKAAALAAVEVVEGRLRTLRRPTPIA
jgi:hypothetical protein